MEFLDIYKDLLYCFNYPHLNGLTAGCLLFSILAPNVFNIFLCYDPINEKFNFGFIKEIYMGGSTEESIEKQ